MMETLESVVMAVVIAYAFGAVAYRMLGVSDAQWARILPVSLVAVLFGEMAWSSRLPGGPLLAGVSLLVSAGFITLFAAADVRWQQIRRFIEQRTGGRIRLGAGAKPRTAKRTSEAA